MIKKYNFFKYFLALAIFVTFSNCNKKDDPVSERINKAQDVLLWIHLSKLKLSPVECIGETIEANLYVGCYFNSPFGKRDVTIWLIEGEKENLIYYAVNGKAKGKISKFKYKDMKPIPSEKYLNLKGNPIKNFVNKR